MYIQESFIKYNRNPNNERRGDCVIRAISLAFGEKYLDIANDLFNKKDGVDAVQAITFMLTLGAVPNFAQSKKENRMPLKDYCQIHKSGIFIACVGKNDGNINHMVCCRNGDWYDTWDSGNDYVFIGFEVPNVSEEEWEKRIQDKNKENNEYTPTSNQIKEDTDDDDSEWSSIKK